MNPGLALLLRHDPRVAELQRVAVPLQLDHPGGPFGFVAGAAGLSVDLQLVVDEDPVELGRKSGILDFLAILHHGRAELHIVGLPL